MFAYQRLQICEIHNTSTLLRRVYLKYKTNKQKQKQKKKKKKNEKN